MSSNVQTDNVTLNNIMKKNGKLYKQTIHQTIITTYPQDMEVDVFYDIKNRRMQQEVESRKDIGNPNIIHQTIYQTITQDAVSPD